MKRRNFETDIEKMLRVELEARGLKEWIDFTCQFPLKHSFIIDIAFTDKKVAVEADGDPFHKPGSQRDAMKTAILTKMGWTVLRYKGSRIYKDCPGCVDEIIQHL